MNVSQAAILKRAADAAVNGQRAQPRGAAAAALGSCCLPSPASSSSSSASASSSSAASSSSSLASNASSSWASSSSSAAAAASSRSALGGGSARRGRNQYYSAGLGGVSNPDRGSLANIPGVKVALSNTINVYDILNCDSFIVAKAAAEKIEEVYA